MAHPAARTAASVESAKSGGLDIRFLVRHVLRRWPLIVILIVLGVIAGQRAQSLFDPSYTGSVSLLIDPKRPGALGADTEFGNLYVDSSKVASVGLIITSLGVLGRVVDLEHLDDDPHFAAPLTSITDWVLIRLGLRAPQPAEDSPTVRRARALYRLGRAVRTMRVGLTYVMTVDVSAYSPELAARLANAVVAAYLQDLQDLKIAATRRDLEWATEQTGVLRREMLSSEQAVEAIRQKYGILETDRSQNSTTDKQLLTDLNSQLAAADAEVAAKRARYEQLQRIQATNGDLGALPEVTSSRVVSELRLSLTEATKKYKLAVRDATSAYIALMHPDDDIKQIKAEIAAEIGRIAEGIVNDYQTVVRRRDAVAAQLAGMARRAQEQSSTEGRIQLREAQQVLETSRALFESHLKQLREVEQQQTRLEPEARVISPAARPDRASFPKPILFLPAGGLIGLFAGTGIGVLGGLLKARRARLDVIEQAVALPVLGKVPRLAHGRTLVTIGRPAAVTYLLANPFSLFADSIRGLRTGLRTSMAPPPRVVVVTSALPGEGKSTVAACLALSNAIAGRKTVLVDMDVRKGSSWAGAGSAIHPFERLPLKVVTVGHTGQSGPDVIESPLFRDSIRALAAEFDLVVLDTPPVLLAAEAIAISDLADASILVAAAGSTPVPLLQEATKLMRAARSPVAGIVVNKLSTKQMGHQYGGSYAAYYKPSNGAGRKAEHNADL